ncbi:hypothetical protein B0J11DRAFT_612868 [Dendryphion nanum]|uniref:Uncharacterized protein n=1 Tax=Dendryphion nanum TaxID=256645 RepID=A0A9P9E3R8_9PLEO|nr:hypothetical protein B0J11DRAFT_612868 [Dendryphion nanum]
MSSHRLSAVFSSYVLPNTKRKHKINNYTNEYGADAYGCEYLLETQHQPPQLTKLAGNGLRDMETGFNMVTIGEWNKDSKTFKKVVTIRKEWTPGGSGLEYKMTDLHTKATQSVTYEMSLRLCWTHTLKGKRDSIGRDVMALRYLGWDVNEARGKLMESLPRWAFYPLPGRLNIGQFIGIVHRWDDYAEMTIYNGEVEYSAIFERADKGYDWIFVRKESTDEWGNGTQVIKRGNGTYYETLSQGKVMSQAPLDNYIEPSFFYRDIYDYCDHKCIIHFDTAEKGKQLEVYNYLRSQERTSGPKPTPPLAKQTQAMFDDDFKERMRKRGEQEQKKYGGSYRSDTTAGAHTNSSGMPWPSPPSSSNIPQAFQQPPSYIPAGYRSDTQSQTFEGTSFVPNPTVLGMSLPDGVLWGTNGLFYTSM